MVKERNYVLCDFDQWFLIPQNRRSYPLEASASVSDYLKWSVQKKREERFWKIYANEYASDLRGNEHYFPCRPELFSGPIFHYCLSSFHNCEDRFHIPFFIRSSHIWFLYIYSQKLRQVALKLTLLFTVANTNQEKKF